MDLRNKLRTLLVMAAADGRLTKDELLFHSDRATAWGMSPDEYNAVIDDALAGNIDLQMPREQSERFDLLTDVVRMMGADGVLHEQEKQLFALIAARLNMDESEVNQVIDRAMRDHRR